MLRIGQVEATATQDGKYTDGSVAGGIAATRLRAAAFNAMQEELAHIVESAGLTLDINDMTQVLKAIQKLTLSRTNPFADIKSDGAAAISTALTNLGLVDASGYGGRLVGPPTVIATSGQFTMPASGNLFRIRVQGAGGGSGSARATSATGLSASGGGGGGAYVELWLTRAELQALIDVAGGYLDIIIGAGGVGGTGGAGGTGGTTQFGSLIVCPGGKGSDYGIAASTSTTALASGGASGADPVIAIPGLDSSKIILSMAGAPGHFGISVQSPTLAGHGANSPLGNGGVGSGASATQSDGKGYGSGAGGVSNGLSSVAKNGANGGDGVIIVEVYA
ncbi:glycine-rich domain-containing protein [Enterobacter roggenkampii]|nr:hypothetical protein [Enterobacter roggenkampii]